MFLALLMHKKIYFSKIKKLVIHLKITKKILLVIKKLCVLMRRKNGPPIIIYMPIGSVFLHAH